jgi:hypothetical protein
MMAHLTRKEGSFRHWRENVYVNHKKRQRLNDLMRTRLISDEDIAKALDIKLEFWLFLKRGVKRIPQRYEKALRELLGDGFMWVTHSYYLDRDLPKIVTADEM